LLDAGAIGALDTGLEVSATKEAMIEQADNPTGAGDTPTGATGASLISLFQSDSVAIKVTRRVNWQRLSQTACVVATGCDYASA